MSHSADIYVDVNVTPEGTGPQPAGFGVPMFLYEHALDSARLAGPFNSAQAVLDEGHASGSPPHLWAQALMSQSPRVSSFYVGRRDAGDANAGDAFGAVLAANTSAWYCAMQERRDDQDILDFAAAVNSATYPKLSLVQSNAASLLAGIGPSYSAQIGGVPADGNYDLVFTGFGLVSPVTVTTPRVGGVPASNDDIAAAMDAALDTAAAGSLGGVLAEVSSAGDTASFRIADGLATGTITPAQPAGASIDVTLTDGDVASRLFDLNYTRTALAYHPLDTEFLDAAWASRCLSFDLDQRKGSWAFKRLSGITGTNLTDTQIAALRAVNANYFAPAVLSSGVPVQPFTAQGWTGFGDAGAGRRIDRTTTQDWAQARLQEALFGVLLRETHGVGFDDAGINRFVASGMGVIAGRGVRAGHFTPFVIPEGEDRAGERTPLIDAPRVRETTTVERTNRSLAMTAIAYERSIIERVIFNLNVNT